MEEKIERIKSTMAGKPTDRVPVILDFEISYACEYAGIDFLEATWNYDKIIEAYEKILDTFEMDANLGMGWLPPQRNEILGSKTWIQNRRNGTMQHPEVMSLSADDYPALIEDPLRCIVERVLPGMYSALGKDSVKDITAISKALLFEKRQVTDFYNKLYDLTYAKGVPIYYGTMFYAPFDLLGDHLRGITQISMDLRRKKRELEAACEALAPVMTDYVENTLPVDADGISCACSWVHLPPMISPRHFEKFFWPTFKNVCDTLAAKGHTLYLQFQGDYTDGRYFDYYSELPEGKVILAVEHQDFKKTLDILGSKNMVCCSYPLDYLTNYSTEECLDKARELMDIGMETKRFYFGFNKPAFSFKDAPPEKMKAVIDFVNAYGKY